MWWSKITCHCPLLSRAGWHGTRGHVLPSARPVHVAAGMVRLREQIGLPWLCGAAQRKDLASLGLSTPDVQTATGSVTLTALDIP